MGAFKDLLEFGKRNRLNPESSTTKEFFTRAQRGLPWGEEKLDLDCDECGKLCFKSVGTTRWRCMYCPATGTIEGAVELTPNQRRAERGLIKEQRAEKRARALRIWDDCVPIGSNVEVATYLGARRLELPPDIDGVMRWHHRCPFGKDGPRPCIVSLFRDGMTDEPMAIHRTHITSASKGVSDRMALGPMTGSVVKLWPLIPGSEVLTIGEGIETVLAAVKLGKGSAPAWAATVANNLASFPVIPGVERLIILADNDEMKKGEKAARNLRRKWLYEGREVVIKIPGVVGWDFNNELTKGGHDGPAN